MIGPDDQYEAVNGLMSEEPGDCFVCEEDRPPPEAFELGRISPHDPYRCENPVSQEDDPT